MATLGLLTCHLDQDLPYFTRIAENAKQYELEICRFTPDSIEPKTELVHGLRYDQETGQWTSDIFPIPEFILDRCFHPTHKQLNQKAIVDWLRNHPDVTFLGSDIPDRRALFMALTNDEVLSSYTPDTRECGSVGEILETLRESTSILLKPSRFSKGKGHYLLSRDGEKIHISTQKGEKRISQPFSSALQVERLIQKIIHTEPYLIQSSLPLQTINGNPFLIYLLMQKDDAGHWQESGRCLCVSPDHLPVTASHGVRTAPFENWFHTLPVKQQILLQDGITTITKRLPLVLENSFGKLHEFALELGITQNGGIWILDVTAKPEHECFVNEKGTATLRYAALLKKGQSVH